MDLKKGELFVITHGAYSDYELIVLVRAKEDLNIEQLINKFNEKYTENKEPHTYPLNSYKLINWLVNIESCVEELELKELNLGYLFNQVSLEKKDEVKEFKALFNSQGK